MPSVVTALVPRRTQDLSHISFRNVVPTPTIRLNSQRELGWKVYEKSSGQTAYFYRLV